MWDSQLKRALRALSVVLSRRQMKFDEICWGEKKKSSYKSSQLHTEVLLNLHTLLICKLTESVGSNALSGARDKQTAINTEEAARNCLPQVSTVVDRRSISTFRGEDLVEHLQKTHLLGCYLSFHRITAFIKSWWITGCKHAEGWERTHLNKLLS